MPLIRNIKKNSSSKAKNRDQTEYKGIYFDKSPFFHSFYLSNGLCPNSFVYFISSLVNKLGCSRRHRRDANVSRILSWFLMYTRFSLCVYAFMSKVILEIILENQNRFVFSKISNEFRYINKKNHTKRKRQITIALSLFGIQIKRASWTDWTLNNVDDVDFLFSTCFYFLCCSRDRTQPKRAECLREWNCLFKNTVSI